MNREYDDATIAAIERVTGGTFWATSDNGLLMDHDHEWLVEYTHDDIERMLKEGAQ